MDFSRLYLLHLVACSSRLPYVLCSVLVIPPLFFFLKEITLVLQTFKVAVSGAGIWPGASALMAAASVEKLREMAALSTDVTSSATETFSVTLRDGPEQSAPCEGEVVDLSFFTAGTGNAGATIVSATFLLLCQPVLTLVRGSSVDAPPWTSPREVDFGEGVGKRMVCRHTLARKSLQAHTPCFIALCNFDLISSNSKSNFLIYFQVFALSYPFRALLHANHHTGKASRQPRCVHRTLKLKGAHAG